MVDQLPEPNQPASGGQAGDERGEAVETHLGRSAAAGTLWLTAQKWAIRLSGFLTIAILTRLISPADFGVVAAASAITPIVLLLADLGLSTYVVQVPELDTKTLSTAFWFSVGTGIALSAALFFAAPLIALAFGISGSVMILQAMSLSVLVTVPASVPLALMRRRLEFRKLAMQSTVATVLAQVVAIVLALVGLGPWALVAQLVITQAVAGLLAWFAADWRPSWEFSPQRMGKMARFGSQIVAVDLLGTTRIMLEAAIITNVLGAAALGYLNIAQRLVQVTQDAGAAAMVPVSTVVFAKVKHSIERLRAGYLRALRIGYAAVAPLLTFVMVDAPAIVPLVFGTGWEPSIPVAQALAIAAILTLGAMIDTGLHYGIGAPGRWFLYELTVDALMVGATFLLAPHGLIWVAGGAVATAMVATIIRWVVVGRLIDYPVILMAGGFARSMVPVAVSGLGGLAVRAVTAGLPTLLGLGLVGMTIALLHVLTVRLISRRVLADVLGLLPLPGPLRLLRKLA